MSVKPKSETTETEVSLLEQLDRLEAAQEEALAQSDPKYTREQLIEMEQTRLNNYLNSVAADLTNWKEIILDLETSFFRVVEDGSGEVASTFKLRCRVPSMVETQKIDQLVALQLAPIPNLNVVSAEAYAFAKAIAGLQILAVPNDDGRYEAWVKTTVDKIGRLRPDFENMPAAYRVVLTELYAQVEMFLNRFLG